MANLVLAPAHQLKLTEKTPANRSPLNLKVASERFLCLAVVGMERSSQNFSPVAVRSVCPHRCASSLLARLLVRFLVRRLPGPHRCASRLLPFARLLSFSSKSLPSHPLAISRRVNWTVVGRNLPHQVGNPW